jgi:hypothetical protein
VSQKLKNRIPAMPKNPVISRILVLHAFLYKGYLYIECDGSLYRIFKETSMPFFRYFAHLKEVFKKK